jgi:glycosyltransferase involved in cell wall biosynthesis
MRILFLNERFLFRFGADRVLILLGRGLAERGHTISTIANRCDRSVLESFVSGIIDLPEPPGRYFYLNEDTAEWLRANWATLFDESTRPDAIFVGGWPFFAAIPFLRTVCPEVVFIDFGAVPLDGYEGGSLLTQQKLRRLRSEFLPQASRIVAISNFILQSQSLVDSAGLVPSQTILLGADHVENGLWAGAQVSGAASGGDSLTKIDQLKAHGRQVILSLGRWEPGCYKNSEQAFELLRVLRNTVPDAALVILSGPDMSIPADLQDAVFPLGFPDDGELVEIMRRVDLGISLSRWEGFNLPLAEMQWMNRPALAFNVGAHPEVAVHPWFLCRDLSEMIEKSAMILRRRVPGEARDPELLNRFQGTFRWKRMVDQYHDMLLQGSDRRVHLVIDVSNSTRDPANSGVIRVTRRFSRALQQFDDPLFVIWDDQSSRYVLPIREEFAQLGQFNGPRLTNEERLSPSALQRVGLEQILERLGRRDPWMIFSETMMEVRFKTVRAYIRGLGFRTAAIFYDAIPVLRPDLCNEEMRHNHRDYMIGLADCDLVIPISHYSGQCLRDFWQAEAVSDGSIHVDVLPGEFGGSERVSQPPTASARIQILCVSTLEPRKNHRRLIEACLLLEKNYPDLDWVLTLVGNKYAGAFEIADWIEEVGAANPRVRWLGIVDDPTLHQLYAEASFTVYPSIIEGFGIPILESIWHGRPCICSLDGVMGELAREGGCLTTDVQDVQALSETIATLARDYQLREELVRQAVVRKLKTWNDYVNEFREAMEKAPLRLEPATVSITHPPEPAVAWTSRLYPSCILDHWQMFDGERLALTGVLARHKPRCSIEIGTFYGGSLSLIAQHSDVVFSIDVDPQSASRAAHLRNVTFLTGKSSDILPLLFRELTAAGVAVDFILLDGDHSKEGVKRDMDLILQYVPLKPLFVMMHDSFNPGCRQAMLESPWQESPYCHWVELDFVPGRLVDNDEPAQGEPWGGLGIAYLQPFPRKGWLRIERSADGLFRLAASHSPKRMTKAS